MRKLFCLVSLLWLCSCSLDGAISPADSRMPGKGGTDSGPRDEPNVGPRPVVQEISPAKAAPGDMLTIYGHFLYGSTVIVRFEGDETRKVNRSIDGRRLMVHVPWAARTGEVTVVVDDKVSEPVDFLVMGGTETPKGALVPVLTGATPARGKFGDRVILTGSNLAGRNRVIVRFGGIEAGAMGVTKAGDRLTALVPQGALSGSLDVVIDGQVSNKLSFVVVDQSGGEVKTVLDERTPPFIEQISPPHGRPGSPVEVIGVRLDGTVFEAHFAGVSTRDVQVIAREGGKSLLVVVPQGASSGMIDITIDGRRTNRMPFQVDP